MKKIIVTNLENNINIINYLEDPTDYIAYHIKANLWGKPERWVKAQVDGVFAEETYLDTQVLETETRKIENGYLLDKDGNPIPSKTNKDQYMYKYIYVDYVKLKAGYEIQILDAALEFNINKKIEEINLQAQTKIVSGFESNALGEPHIYDSKLEDQFNFKAMVDANLDTLCRCTNKANNIKTYYPHTILQLKQAYQEFYTYKSSILQKADTFKNTILNMTNPEDVINFNLIW